MAKAPAVDMSSHSALERSSRSENCRWGYAWSCLARGQSYSFSDTTNRWPAAPRYGPRSSIASPLTWFSTVNSTARHSPD